MAVSCPKSTPFQNSSCLKEQSSSFIGGSLKGVSLQLKPRKDGKNVPSLVVASASAVAEAASTGGGGGGRFYLNITGFPFPLGPFLNRRTIRTEVGFSVILHLIWDIY